MAGSKVDLHVHSHYSDGSDSIEEILKKAHERNVNLLSFVDHDMAGVYERALPVAEDFDIQLVPGIEISAYDFKRNRKVHVLGYNYNSTATNIRALVRALRERRHLHSLKQLEALKEYGMHIDIDEVISIAGPSQVIYKQHIMRALTNESYYSPQYKELYQRLFKGGGPARGDIEYVDVKDAIGTIKRDGGVCVIAHPGQLDSYDMIEENIDLGIDGVEILHPDHTDGDVDRIRYLSRNYGLFMTGGSDYHGTFGDDVKIGVNPGLLRLGDELFKVGKSM